MNGHVSDEQENEELLRMEGPIRQCFSSKLKVLKFPREVENYFNDFDTPTRNKRFLIMGIVGLLFYNLFMIGDRLMLPDIYKTAWFIRAFMVTPVAVVVFFLISKEIVKREADFLVSVVIAMVSGSIMVMLLISNHPNVVHYHTGIMVVITFGNIIVRPRFNYAVIYSSVVFVMYVLTAYSVAQMDSDTITNSCLVLFTNTFLTLVGNFHFRIEERREFLYTLLMRIDSIKLEENNRLLEKLSISDKLTGLSNRRHFDFAFEKEWRNCVRNGYPLSMIFIDIDYFKSYNDYYGHQQGDLCLEIIAKGLASVAQRPGDFIARYGGEEFVVLLSNTAIKDSLTIAENARKLVESYKIKHNSSQDSSFITISLGVASVEPSDSISADDLVNYADKALYKAKSEGRNKVCEYRDEDL